jgi:hypothetical protein
MTRLIPILVVLLLSLPARAVDNSTHKVALGAIADFAGQVGPPTLSLKLPLTPKWELSFMLGFNIASSSEFVPGVKGWYILIPQKNLNFYLSASTAIDVFTSTGFNAFLVRLGPGVELFATDWPNVGFMAEFGVALSILNGPGDNFGSAATTGFGLAGLHYYF